MSNSRFPGHALIVASGVVVMVPDGTLPGLSFNTAFKPQFKTKILSAVSGREYRAQLMSSPIYSITLEYEFLKSVKFQKQFETLAGFFMQMRGAWDNFLFINPSDCAVENQGFGVGDGVKKSFQLTRTFGGYVEPVFYAQAFTNLRFGGVSVFSNLPTLLDNFSDTGVVTFKTAPAAGSVLDWSGFFAYKARFALDVTEYTQFANTFWAAKKIELIGSLGGKI